MSLSIQHSKILALLGTALLAVTAGCAKPTDTVERKSETTQVVGDQTTTTTTESTQVGTNRESKSETKVDGDRALTTEQFIGTVTVFNPGKSIEVMTGEKKTTRFELDENNLVANVDPKIAVGSRVRLTREKASDGTVRIFVTIEG